MLGISAFALRTSGSASFLARGSMHSIHQESVSHPASLVFQRRAASGAKHSSAGVKVSAAQRVNSDPLTQKSDTRQIWIVFRDFDQANTVIRIPCDLKIKLEIHSYDFENESLFI